MAASQKNVIVNDEVVNAMNSNMNDLKNADDLESSKVTRIESVEKKSKEIKIQKNIVTHTRDNDIAKLSDGINIPTKEELAETNKRIQEIRHGKYILGWQYFPFRMWVALVVEFFVGFLAILTAKGDFQKLSTFVSILYLVYIFSSSKSENTVHFINEFINRIVTGVLCCDIRNFCPDQDCGCFGCYLHTFLLGPVIMEYLTFPIHLTYFVVLDLVSVHESSTTSHTMSFAAADMVVIIASINYASRAVELSIAIPLLVSFDFLTKFSTKIVDTIVTDDELARSVADKEKIRFLKGSDDFMKVGSKSGVTIDQSIFEQFIVRTIKRFFLDQFYIILFVGIVGVALFLAFFSITIN